MHEPVKAVTDWAAFGATLAVVAGWLPSLAALATFIWTVIRIFETPTVQNWLHRHDPNWKPIRRGQNDES
jgi:hypothetical protein